MRIAIKLDDDALINSTLNECPDQLIQKQLCFMLSRQRIVPQLERENEELTKIACNHHLTNYFMHLAKDLD